MSVSPSRPFGFLSFTLHAHLPYVVNHGTWPHGLEWLHEAAAETYLPLLRVLARLERDGIPLHLNLNLSPILLEQLAHPVFLAEFPGYLQRKITAAGEDEAFFTQSGEPHYAETARFWHTFFTDALDHFHSLNGDIVAAFRGFHQRGQIEIITCAATHGYLPLLGTDASVRAQVRTAVATHTRHLGAPPRGIWSPECGYRPAGPWQQPVPNADGSPTPVPANRIGTEQAFAEQNLRFFFVDTHLVEDSEPVASPYSFPLPPQARIAHKPTPHPAGPGALYRPYLVEGPSLHATPPLPPVAVFPRDPRTGLQVWSGEHGYPGDGNYVDFHKKRWPGGHRYWRVTGPHVDQAGKQPYFPHEAAAKVRDHADHFVHIVYTALNEAQTSTSTSNSEAPPILTAPFDAELFGHWWFEGPLWLEAVARTLHQYPTGVELIAAGDYLDKHPHPDTISLAEGSWGAEGTNAVWLNPETSWTWTHIYPAEHFIQQLATEGRWRDSPLATKIAKQLCRELLLLESSDWQFLITTGAARDYAEARFTTHNDQFLELKSIWQSFLAEGRLNEHQQTRFQAIQERDSIFPDIDPADWAS